MSDASEHYEVVNNYTKLWKISGKIYTSGDWVLPIPIHVQSAISFITVMAPMSVVLIAVGLAGNLTSWGVALAVAGFFTFVSVKPGPGGRSFNQFLIDHSSVLFLPDEVHDCESGTSEGWSWLVSHEVFVPKGDSLYLPSTMKE